MQQYFPTTSAAAIDLLDRLLSFDPGAGRGQGVGGQRGLGGWMGCLATSRCVAGAPEG